MLYVVDTKAEANDLEKNYYVTSTKTLIANHHKTGVIIIRVVRRLL
jgi:hypothetical protein